MRRVAYIILGIIGLVLGFIGAILPLMPSFPFLLMAAICFGKSSERLDNWFKSTKLYKDNLESYVQGTGMSKKAKIRLMITVTLLMSIGFIMMDKVPIGRAVLFVVWLGHILYFQFGVKTKEEI